jgi:hypothetical protein
MAAFVSAPPPPPPPPPPNEQQQTNNVIAPAVHAVAPASNVFTQTPSGFVAGSPTAVLTSSGQVVNTVPITAVKTSVSIPAGEGSAGGQTVSGTGITSPSTSSLNITPTVSAPVVANQGISSSFSEPVQTAYGTAYLNPNTGSYEILSGGVTITGQVPVTTGSLLPGNAAPVINTEVSPLSSEIPTSGSNVKGTINTTTGTVNITGEGTFSNATGAIQVPVNVESPGYSLSGANVGGAIITTSYGSTPSPLNSAFITGANNDIKFSNTVNAAARTGQNHVKYTTSPLQLDLDALASARNAANPTYSTINAGGSVLSFSGYQGADTTATTNQLNKSTKVASQEPTLQSVGTGLTSFAQGGENFIAQVGETAYSDFQPQLNIAPSQANLFTTQGQQDFFSIPIIGAATNLGSGILNAGSQGAATFINEQTKALNLVTNPQTYTDISKAFSGNLPTNTAQTITTPTTKIPIAPGNMFTNYGNAVNTLGQGGVGYNTNIQPEHPYPYDQYGNLLSFQLYGAGQGIKNVVNAIPSSFPIVNTVVGGIAAQPLISASYLAGSNQTPVGTAVNLGTLALYGGAASEFPTSLPSIGINEATGAIEGVGKLTLAPIGETLGNYFLPTPFTNAAQEIAELVNIGGENSLSEGKAVETELIGGDKVLGVPVGSGLSDVTQEGSSATASLRYSLGGTGTWQDFINPDIYGSAARQTGRFLLNTLPVSTAIGALGAGTAYEQGNTAPIQEAEAFGVGYGTGLALQAGTSTK